MCEKVRTVYNCPPPQNKKRIWREGYFAEVRMEVHVIPLPEFGRGQGIMWNWKWKSLYIILPSVT